LGDIKKSFFVTKKLSASIQGDDLTKLFVDTTDILGKISLTVLTQARMFSLVQYLQVSLGANPTRSALKGVAHDFADRRKLEGFQL